MRVWGFQVTITILATTRGLIRVATGVEPQRVS